jgi:epoxyqueuosine reductase QueG
MLWDRMEVLIMSHVERAHPSQTEELREYLLAKGADLVGFGSVDLMEGAPDIMKPKRYLPDARSMISIGMAINEASCDLIARSVQESSVPASYHSYQRFTLTLINPQLDRLAYHGAKFLERRGFRAYPFPANIPHLLKPSELYPGGPGDISHKHVAVACGLGHIGWHTLLMTPEFSTRQKLTSIVTNAPLRPDPIRDEQLCDPEACGFQCSHACPTGAIPKRSEEGVSLQIGGHDVSYARLVGWKCRWGCSGMLKCTGGYKNIPMPKTEPGPEELLRYKAEMDPWQERVKQYNGLTPYCGRCLCICPKQTGG